MKLTYHWEGDYLVPDLVAPEAPRIGIWGERRRQFLCKQRKPLYDAMLMNGIVLRPVKILSRLAITVHLIRWNRIRHQG